MRYRYLLAVERLSQSASALNKRSSRSSSDTVASIRSSMRSSSGSGSSTQRTQASSTEDTDRIALEVDTATRSCDYTRKHRELIEVQKGVEGIRELFGTLSEHTTVQGVALDRLEHDTCVTTMETNIAVEEMNSSQTHVHRSTKRRLLPVLLLLAVAVLCLGIAIFVVEQAEGKPSRHPSIV